MANRKELKMTMPCGFAADTGVQLNFTEVKSRLSEVIPIDKLSDEQKRKLTIDSWNHGLWVDIADSECFVTKEKAIAAVNDPTSALGDELVRLTMMGYARIYESFSPSDEEKHQHQKVSFEPSEAQLVTSQMKVESSAGLSNFTIHNSLSETVFIYKKESQSDSGNFVYVTDISASSNVVETPDFTPQIWKAFTSKPTDPKSRKLVCSSYAAYPGCTTWNIASFPASMFVPSSADKQHSVRYNVELINNLKTYVNIWWIDQSGSLIYVDIWIAGETESSIKNCVIGDSYVATQGSTVISKYFFDSTDCTTWTIDSVTPPGGEEIFAGGDNNYIFYQVKTPQDDTVSPAPKNFTKQITICKGTTYLYASLFNSYDAYFGVPEGVKLSIESTDSSGSTKQYNSNTDTDDLYIEMTPDGQSLQKLCVQNPTVGQWKITIQAMTNTPVYFQFQTVPTKDPYPTMEAALSSDKVLGSNWEEIAYAGFTNIANMQHVDTGNEEDLEYPKLGALPILPLAVAAVGQTIVGNVILWYNACKAVQNDLADIKQAVSSVCEAVVPTPSGLGTLLLVDADGADVTTQVSYSVRKQYLYAAVQSGEFRKNYLKLVGKDEAVKGIFQPKLADPSIKYVSVAGHGKSNSVLGYSDDNFGPYPPILTALDVAVNPVRVEGKIFHLFSCNTANELGPEMIKNGATAFIGYNQVVKIITSTFPGFQRMTIEPDCAIDLLLLDGKTVDEAVLQAKGVYTKMMNLAYYIPTIYGILENNRDSLVVLGDGKAKLLTKSADKVKLSSDLASVPQPHEQPDREQLELSLRETENHSTSYRCCARGCCSIC